MSARRRLAEKQVARLEQKSGGITDKEIGYAVKT